MTRFELLGLNPFDNFNVDILGFTGITDEEGIKIDKYDMVRGQEELFGIKFTGVKKIDDQIDEDTQCILHGGDINFDIVYNTYVDDDEYKTVWSLSYEYTDRMLITELPSMIADVFSNCFCEFIHEKTNIKDYMDMSMLNFMLDPSNREYFAKFVYLITTKYIQAVEPRLTYAEVDYYTKLRRIVGILNE